MAYAVAHSAASNRRSRVRRAVVAAVALAALGLSTRSAHAIYIRSDKSVSSYNTLTTKSAFNPVGYIADTDFDFAFSSGTLITPTKVLTAAHVVDDNGDLKVDDPSQIKRLVFGLQRNVPTTLKGNVASVAINPWYKGGKDAFDLAVITLKSPITTTAGAKLSSINMTGHRGAMIGYGFQGTGTRDGLSGANDKLAALNMISVLSNGTYETDFDSPFKNTSTWNPTTPLLYEGTTAAGDSGSPLMADFGNDIWRIVGVLHGGFNPKNENAPSQYGDVSIYASLTNQKNVDWLKSQGLSFTAGGTATASSSDAQSVSTRSIPVPEPASLGLLLPAAIGLLGRRRVRQSV
jgi:V8-like Glu-specific endopeptidase